MERMNLTFMGDKTENARLSRLFRSVESNQNVNGRVIDPKFSHCSAFQVRLLSAHIFSEAQILNDSSRF
jgi:hypothetical protein